MLTKTSGAESACGAMWASAESVWGYGAWAESLKLTESLTGALGAL